MSRKGPNLPKQLRALSNTNTCGLQVLVVSITKMHQAPLNPASTTVTTFPDWLITDFLAHHASKPRSQSPPCMARAPSTGTLHSKVSNGASCLLRPVTRRTERDIIGHFTKGHPENAQLLQPKYGASHGISTGLRPLNSCLQGFEVSDRIFDCVPSVNLEMVIHKLA